MTADNKRAIKFRAWDSKQNRFVQAKELLLGAWPSGHSDNTDWFLETEQEEQGCIGDTRLPTTGFILQQFTGLHDKNGKECYEGDIVKLKDLSTYTVKWNAERTGFFPFILYPYTSFEIIANEYESTKR